jgi:hypothetical protein
LSERQPSGLRRQSVNARATSRARAKVLRLVRGAFARFFGGLLVALRIPVVGLASAGAATILAAGVFAGVDVVLQDSMSPSRNAIAFVLVGMLFLQAFGGIGATRFWKRWLPWQRAAVEEPGIVLGAALASVALLTMLYAATTAVFDANGWLESRPATEDKFAWRALEYYAWQFFDAIPALEIPSTVEWSRGTTYVDVQSGGLLLAYKLLAIVPIVRLIVELVEARRQAGAEAHAVIR